MGWIFGSVHKGDLRRCYNAFWRHVDRGERRFDSAWLALLCMIFAIVLQARTDLQRDDLRSDDLATLGRACLELRDWRTKPTYRVVQTLYASMFYSQNACDREGGESPCSLIPKAANALSTLNCSDSPCRHDLSFRGVRVLHESRPA